MDKSYSKKQHGTACRFERAGGKPHGLELTAAHDMLLYGAICEKTEENTIEYFL